MYRIYTLGSRYSSYIGCSISENDLTKFLNNQRKNYKFNLTRLSGNLDKRLGFWLYLDQYTKAKVVMGIDYQLKDFMIF